MKLNSTRKQEETQTIRQSSSRKIIVKDVGTTDAPPQDTSRLNRLDEYLNKSAIQRECEELAKLLERKSHDYGEFCPPTLVEISSEKSILIRMDDKIRRLRNLIALTPPEGDQLNIAKAEYYESIEDTVRDLAGYCILFLIHQGERNDFSTSVGSECKPNLETC